VENWRNADGNKPSKFIRTVELRTGWGILEKDEKLIFVGVGGKAKQG
jgi:hypothetical protein